ncbi:MAG TPA: MFS transporter [Jatrophihabitans sp.]|nr:MFS transporter [Jatrophihabitans sp.]
MKDISGVNGKRVTFTDVLRVREFRILWLADAQSAAGDQIGRVALSVLVFERTNSAILTAVTYALTFLPALLGGAFLSSLADRMPRRRVMVACDLARAVVLMCMALPGMPLAVVFLLLILAVLFEAPFTAAESAMVPSILPDDHYVVGTGLRTITHQVAQLAGFTGGGLAIALMGPRRGLALDALTFLLSALLVMIGVQDRPAAAQPEHGDGGGGWSAFRGGMRLVFRNPKLRALVGLAWLAGVYVVPEGVAAPYAAKVSHGATAVGLLMAAMPLGTALGTYLFVRWVPAESRSAWMAPLGVAAGVPFACCLALPPLGISLVLWMLAGLFFCYQVQVVTEFVRTVPDAQRGQAVGIASSGLYAVQGVGVLLGGWVATIAGVAWSVAGAGLVGMALALTLGVLWSRARGHDEPAAVAAAPRSASSGGSVSNSRPARHRA